MTGIPLQEMLILAYIYDVKVTHNNIKNMILSHKFDLNFHFIQNG